tara:strand:- start:689 stop:940 length:252 start_codon:yes stop_codon:yes gene_type:complete
MTRIELAQALTDYATEDLGTAKREGDVAIAETNRGCISVACERWTGLFSIRSTGGDVLLNVSHAVAHAFIVDSYDVSAVEITD